MREFILWKSWHFCNLLLVKNMDMVLFLYTISRSGWLPFQENQGNFRGIVREICSIFAISGKCQGNLTLFFDIQEWRNILPHHFSSLCHYLFCEMYVVERSIEYQVNDEFHFCPTGKKGVFRRYRMRLSH